MNLEKFLMVCLFVVFTSCASKKKVTEKSSSKKTTNEVVNNQTDSSQSEANTDTSGTTSNGTNDDLRNSSSNNTSSTVKNNNVNSNSSNTNNSNTTEEGVHLETTSETITKTYKGSTSYTQQYVDRYVDIAVREMHKHKIPASVTLAQGILESGSGRSPLALKSNNHFGIKCHKGWKGSSVRHDDDRIGECFRKYKHPETSYEDHSKFLSSRSRYAKLFKLDITDYVGWSYGLKKAGYATDPKYPRKLITIIKKYHLYKYDSKEGGNITLVNNEYQGTSSIIHQVVKGDTLYSLSKRYGTTVQEIKDLNGMTNNNLSINQELVMP